MRKNKTVTSPPQTYEKLDYIECDLCRARTNDSDCWPFKGSMGYDINESIVEVTVKHRTGASYPDGGHADSTHLDICPTCFKEKLVPWFEAQSGKPRVEEEYW